MTPPKRGHPGAGAGLGRGHRICSNPRPELVDEPLRPLEGVLELSSSFERVDGDQVKLGS
jgi:hypothetical protein